MSYFPLRVREYQSDGTPVGELMVVESRICLSRPITSYSKVQSLVANYIRNRPFQLRRKRIRGLKYLDLGCGRNSHAEFINVDFLWHPAVDICWDITRGIPFPSGSMAGIFTEHCLEHFSLPVGIGILQECRRVLVPGGVLRIVVPDAELYLRTYYRQLNGEDSSRFPFQDREKFNGLYSPILSVNRIFYQDRGSSYGHRFMYDFQLLDLLMRDCGFDSVGRRDFNQGADRALLIDTPSRACESLYVEGAKP